MKILITGGAGYIGTKLTKVLLVQEDVSEILIYDNLSKSHNNFFLGENFKNGNKLRAVQGDILDSRQLKKCLEGVDVVVHLAAKVTTPFANADPHFYEQVNHWGTAEVVYAVEESDVKKFIYLSSTSAYGASTELIDESTEPSPHTFYGISKKRGEEHTQRLSQKINGIVLRAGNVYGFSKSMRFDAVINRFMFDANFANRIQIFGTGKQSRAFIHVDYLVDSLIKSIVHEVPSSIYNLVDKNLHIFEVVDVLKEIYPSLEFLFSNQHMNLRELMVNRDSLIYDHIERYESHTLKEELIEFKKRFAF
ncbi:MAG: NAD-dependent epimerase/dehydratase family protein [Cytophagales bacterium]|nr:NAD-dependent epimerase/dehydratase family protein [Cytophagales bacterium]